MSTLAISHSQAINIFDILSNTVRDCLIHQNLRHLPVLSLAVYGEMLPVKPNDNAENRATNRRIDLRIVMHTPANEAEIANIRQQLRGVMQEAQP